MANRNEQTVIISKELHERISYILEHEPENESECFDAKEPAITVTAKFDDGHEVDVKCCGVSYEEGVCNTGWTEAVLFDADGNEVAYTEPEECFIGDWFLGTRDGNEYVVHVLVEE